jgi:hypothetical protein
MDRLQSTSIHSHIEPNLSFLVTSVETDAYTRHRSGTCFFYMGAAITEEEKITYLLRIFLHPITIAVTYQMQPHHTKSQDINTNPSKGLRDVSGSQRNIPCHGLEMCIDPVQSVKGLP